MSPILVGEVENITSEGQFILRTDSKVKVGSTVTDRSQRIVGRITRVFGPVKRPYVSVAPKNKKNAGLAMMGKKLYLNE